MSSPPPPNPLTTTTVTTTTTDFLKSVARNHSHPSIYQTLYNPQPTTTVQHSNSRSHRQQPPISDQNVVVGIIPNSGGVPPRPVAGGFHHGVNRSYGLSNSDAHLQQSLVGGGATVVSASANTKVAGGQSSVPAKNNDDAFVIVRDRKVQVSEGTSLYAQCRSWLKNGATSEKQPQYLGCVKSLPKPLPASTVEATKEDEMEIEEETQDVDNMSAKELLQQHVNRAKKVRARFRNQRLQKIERYKDRLALLLPPVVDQQPKNDPAI